MSVEFHIANCPSIGELLREGFKIELSSEKGRYHKLTTPEGTDVPISLSIDYLPKCINGVKSILKHFPNTYALNDEDYGNLFFRSEEELGCTRDEFIKQHKITLSDLKNG